MKVLVVGTSPPPGGRAARALAMAANARREAGDVVEILSPDPVSAAHRSARLDGFFLAAQLAWLSRRFDAVELRIEAGLPCRATTSRLARAGYLLALGASLRGYGDVTLRLDSPIPIPGGVGGRATNGLWGAARRIVVESTEDYDQICRVPAIEASRVEIEEPVLSTGAADKPWPSPTDPDLRRAVLDVVRARSEADRRAATARDLVGVVASPGEQRVSPSTFGVARLVAEKAARRVARRPRS